MGYKAAVLVPLYIYPFPGAWKPLHQAISAHQNLQFVVILNPHNGPGATELPDAHYKREIRKLNAYPNVCTIGYVRVDYCKRSLGEVGDDITRYAGWSRDFAQMGLGVEGVFVDETPNIHSVDAENYLTQLDAMVKKTDGIRGQRLTIHNPGTVPEPGFASPGPDITTIFEASYAEYRADVVQQRITNLLSYGKTQCAYIVHSVPAGETKRLVSELRQRAQYIFVTELRENFYVQFGQSWREFITAMQLD